MSCNATREKFSEYIDRQLPAAEASEVERHVAQCAPCRTELQELRRAVSAVAALPRVRAPRNFAAGVAARIAADSVAPVAARGGVLLSMSRHTGLLKLVSGIAAVFLVYFSLRGLTPSGVPVQGKPAAIGKETTLPKPGEMDLRKSPAPPAPAAANEKPESAGATSKENGTGSPDFYARGKSGEHGAGQGGGVDKKDLASAMEDQGKDVERTRKSQTPNLAVQHITVYSSDIAVDSRQVQSLLGDSGYTYSVEDEGTIRVRVPASRATDLVAALGKVPGGFRAEERKVLVVEEAEKKRSDVSPEKAVEKLDAGLVADSEQLEKALRRHLDESNKEIAKAKTSPPRSAGLREGKQKRSKEEQLAGGGGSGPKADEPGQAQGDGQSWKGGALAGGRDHNEQEEGDVPLRESQPPGAPGDSDRSGYGNSANAGKPPAGGEPGLHDGDDSKSGSDSVEELAKQERAQDDKVADALKAVEEMKRSGAAEEAVFLVIEFRVAPADAAPAADPAKK